MEHQVVILETWQPRWQPKEAPTSHVPILEIKKLSPREFISTDEATQLAKTGEPGDKAGNLIPEALG